jgi:PAS domain S-box-containing protein
MPDADRSEAALTEKLRLLLVEDDPSDIHIVVQQLQNADVCEYTLQTVHTAADAEALLAKDPSIDCVILDLRLPDSDGIATVERIHSIVPDTPRAASARPSGDRWSAEGPILDRVRVPAVYIDPQLIIKCANKRFTDLVGFSENDIVGAAFTEVLAVDDLVDLALQIREVVRGEKPAWEGIVGLVRRGGMVARRRIVVAGIDPPEGERADLLVLVDPQEQ